FQRSVDHSALHSFPTRRSSDLDGGGDRRGELARKGKGPPARRTFPYRPSPLGALADLEDLGAAVRAGAGDGRLAVLHGDVLRILDRKSTRLNSSHLVISYAVFC